MSDTVEEAALEEAALEYHRQFPPGKIAIKATKPLASQHDLALAYSPGVAAACRAIVENDHQASQLTARGNLVAVITNGTAVLGLGAIGPLAAKPVMEGKGVLFKKFAGIDVFDIEIDALDTAQLIDIIASLEPSFGGINLEDIRSPECFEVEMKLRERMRIPVFHDDQHGTAIIVAAAIRNGLRIVGKRLKDVKLVTSGAGASAIGCLSLLIELGLSPENILVTDRSGVIYEGRDDHMEPHKKMFARVTEARSLADAIVNADIFLGLSTSGILTPDMVSSMAPYPLIFALANPTPEIWPEAVKAVRADAIIATGRSDYPNQVNNVLCFPFIFRGALDVGATSFTLAMTVAAVNALADIALIEQSDIVASAYAGKSFQFGPEYLIPKPFDPRLIVEIASAVAKAAMSSGVATNPISDIEGYRDRLRQFTYRSGHTMRPVFAKAKEDPRRIVYAEGEEQRVLRAVQVVLDEKLAFPILIGRQEVIQQQIERLGLRLKVGENIAIFDPLTNVLLESYGSLYHQIMERRGVIPEAAQRAVRSNTTTIAALMVRQGEADGMIAGVVGSFLRHLPSVVDVIGLKPGITVASAMNALILSKGTIFLCDTQVSTDPSASEIAQMTLLAVESVRRFGITPKVALLSHSNFGSRDAASALKLRQALSEIQAQAPDLEVEGEMQADAALSEELRMHLFPHSRLKGEANLLILPTLDAAHIALNLLRLLGDGLSVGPLLLGTARPAHIVNQSVSVRGIVNITSLAVVDAQSEVKKVCGE